MLVNKIYNFYKTYGLAGTLSKITDRINIDTLNPGFLIRKAHDSLGTKNKWQLPTYIQIEPTNLCNLNCLSCNRKEQKQFGKMSLASFKTIIDQFSYIRMVKLQGMGEPLLNPDFFLMLEYLKKRGIKTYCTTNGTLLNEKRVLQLIALCDVIEISLDSPDKKQIEAMRLGLDFDNVLSNIRYLAKNLSDNEILINYVLFDDNFEQLKDMVNLLKDLDVKFINVVSVQSWSENESIIMQKKLKSEKISELKNIRALAKSKGVNLCFSEPVGKFSLCPWYKDKCFITWDGFVTPCCQRPDPAKYSIGNVFKEDISKIWNNDPYLSLRESLINNNPLSMCVNCSLIN